MPKRYSSDHVLRVLRRNGFLFVSQRGSHVKVRRLERTVIVPVGRKELPIGTLASILRQSGLDKDALE